LQIQIFLKLLNEKDIANNTNGISDFCWLVGTLAREIAVVGVPTDHDGVIKQKFEMHPI